MSFRIDVNFSKSHSWKVTQLGFELGCGWLHSWSSFCFTQCYSTMTNFVTYQFIVNLYPYDPPTFPMSLSRAGYFKKESSISDIYREKKNSKSRTTTLTISFTPRYISKENKNTNSKKIYALEFIIAKLYKQPMCPSIHRWVDKDAANRGSFIITILISILVISLFTFSVSSCFSLGIFFISKNLSSYSRLSVLLACCL